MQKMGEDPEPFVHLMQDPHSRDLAKVSTSKVSIAEAAGLVLVCRISQRAWKMICKTPNDVCISAGELRGGGGGVIAGWGKIQEYLKHTTLGYEGNTGFELVDGQQKKQTMSLTILVCLRMLVSSRKRCLSRPRTLTVS